MELSLFRRAALLNSGYRWRTCRQSSLEHISTQRLSEPRVWNLKWSTRSTATSSHVAVTRTPMLWSSTPFRAIRKEAEQSTQTFPTFQLVRFRRWLERGRFASLLIRGTLG